MLLGKLENPPLFESNTAMVTTKVNTSGKLGAVEGKRSKGRWFIGRELERVEFYVPGEKKNAVKVEAGKLVFKEPVKKVFMTHRQWNKMVRAINGNLWRQWRRDGQEGFWFVNEIEWLLYLIEESQTGAPRRGQNRIRNRRQRAYNGNMVKKGKQTKRPNKSDNRKNAKSKKREDQWEARDHRGDNDELSAYRQEEAWEQEESEMEEDDDLDEMPAEGNGMLMFVERVLRDGEFIWVCRGEEEIVFPNGPGLYNHLPDDTSQEYRVGLDKKTFQHFGLRKAQLEGINFVVVDEFNLFMIENLAMGFAGLDFGLVINRRQCEGYSRQLKMFYEQGVEFFMDSAVWRRLYRTDFATQHSMYFDGEYYYGPAQCRSRRKSRVERIKVGDEWIDELVEWEVPCPPVPPQMVQGNEGWFDERTYVKRIPESDKVRRKSFGFHKIQKSPNAILNGAKVSLFTHLKFVCRSFEFRMPLVLSFNKDDYKLVDGQWQYSGFIVHRDVANMADFLKKHRLVDVYRNELVSNNKLLAVYSKQGPLQRDDADSVKLKYNKSKGKESDSPTINVIYGAVQWLFSGQSKEVEIYEFDNVEKGKWKYDDDDIAQINDHDELDRRPHNYTNADIVLKEKKKLVEVIRIHGTDARKLYQKYREQYGVLESLEKLACTKKNNGTYYQETIDHMYIEQNLLTEMSTTKVSPHSAVMKPGEHHSRLERYANTAMHINSDQTGDIFQNTVLYTQLSACSTINRRVVVGGHLRNFLPGAPETALREF